MQFWTRRSWPVNAELKIVSCEFATCIRVTFTKTVLIFLMWLIWLFRGLDLSKWRDLLAARGEMADMSKFTALLKTESSLNAVIIDCTASAKIADMYYQWLKQGIHIVTPNKRANSGPFDQVTVLLKCISLLHNVRKFGHCQLRGWRLIFHKIGFGYLKCSFQVIDNLGQNPKLEGWISFWRRSLWRNCPSIAQSDAAWIPEMWSNGLLYTSLMTTDLSCAHSALVCAIKSAPTSNIHTLFLWSHCWSWPANCKHIAKSSRNWWQGFQGGGHFQASWVATHVLEHIILSFSLWVLVAFQYIGYQNFSLWCTSSK